MNMEWWKILGIVIVALLLIVILYIFFQENPQKYYRMARRAHKKGEAAYHSGDFVAAESFYTKADAMRKKARELE